MIQKGTLATTRSVVEVGLDPHSLLEEDRLKWDTLAGYLGLPEEKFKKQHLKTRPSSNPKVLRDIRWVKLKEEVDEGTYRKIQELRIKGVHMETLSIQDYIQTET